MMFSKAIDKAIDGLKEDMSLLRARMSSLIGEVSGIDHNVRSCNREILSLQAEVKRLTKSNDALVKYLELEMEILPERATYTKKVVYPPSHTLVPKPNRRTKRR